MNLKASVTLLIVVLFCSCTSVKKFNENRTQKIAVSKLQEDINFVEKKLKKLYPNYDLYTSKQQLQFSFDSIRNVVKTPLTSKEFFFIISPVIAKVHQGHMSMSPVYKKYTKKEAKILKKKGDGPLSQFTYDWENQKLYITKNKSKIKSIAIGAEVISINDVQPQTLYNQYKNTYTSDGYNTTFLRKYFSKRFSNFLVDEIGVNDSLTFVLKQNDSVFKKVVKRIKPEKKKTQQDTITKKVSDKIAKAKQKKIEENKAIFGYNKTNKEYAKAVQFVGKDSAVAVLRLLNFSEGNHVKAYKIIFDSIKKQKCHTLIIDLRDNPGGKVNDVVNLYSYLTKEEFTMMQPAIVTSKTSLWRAGLFSKIPKVVYPIAGVVYPFYMGFSFFSTKKTSNNQYEYMLTGSKKRQPKATAFAGKKYVIINGGSFSASCLLASTLKSDKNVTFVGEETGGDFNGTVAGLMPVLKLPNTKIPWRIGLMNICPTNQTSIKGRGIFPDVEIISTIKDKIKNKDPEMEWILNDLKK